MPSHKGMQQDSHIRPSLITMEQTASLHKRIALDRGFSVQYRNRNTSKFRSACIIAQVVTRPTFFYDCRRRYAWPNTNSCIVASSQDGTKSRLTDVNFTRDVVLRLKRSRTQTWPKHCGLVIRNCSWKSIKASH